MARALEKTRGERAARLYRSLPGAAWGRPVFLVSSAARDDTSRPVHAQARHTRPEDRKCRACACTGHGSCQGHAEDAAKQRHQPLRSTTS